MAQSHVAQALIEQAKGGEECTKCKHVFSRGETVIIGATLDKRYGYSGGLYCPSHWLADNYSLENERTLKMEQAELDKLGIPNLKRYIAPEQGKAPWGMKHSDLINLNVIVISFTDIETNYGQAYLAECIVEGKREKVLFGAQVLMEELDKVKADLPMEFRVAKPGKYYTFVAPK